MKHDATKSELPEIHAAGSQGLVDRVEQRHAGGECECLGRDDTRRGVRIPDRELTARASDAHCLMPLLLIRKSALRARADPSSAGRSGVPAGAGVDSCPHRNGRRQVWRSIGRRVAAGLSDRIRCTFVLPKPKALTPGAGRPLRGPTAGSVAGENGVRLELEARVDAIAKCGVGGQRLVVQREVTLMKLAMPAAGAGDPDWSSRCRERRAEGGSFAEDSGKCPGSIGSPIIVRAANLDMQESCSVTRRPSRAPARSRPSALRHPVW